MDQLMQQNEEDQISGGTELQGKCAMTANLNEHR
jgi:hypothetical protein